MTIPHCTMLPSLSASRVSRDGPVQNLPGCCLGGIQRLPSATGIRLLTSQHPTRNMGFCQKQLVGIMSWRVSAPPKVPLPLQGGVGVCGNCHIQGLSLAKCQKQWSFLGLWHADDRGPPPCTGGAAPDIPARAPQNSLSRVLQQGLSSAWLACCFATPKPGTSWATHQPHPEIWPKQGPGKVTLQWRPLSNAWPTGAPASKEAFCMPASLQPHSLPHMPATQA